MDPTQPTTRVSPGDRQPLIRRVAADLHGARVDVFLATQPEVASRTLAKALIQAAQVQVEEGPCKPAQILAAGQLVRFDPVLVDSGPRTPATPVADPVILFEDAFLLVIDKPPGLVAHPPNVDQQRRVSVATWAAAHFPGLPCIGGDDRPGIVHRLDKETSGVMVLAKTEDAFHFLKGEFKARRVEKEYRAIAYGVARFDSDFIERNIGSHPKRGDVKVVVKEGGREATTYYEVIERFADFTHFACHPKSGRTHQIRVHMTSIGHGLVGDRVYRSRNHVHSTVPPGAPHPGRHCLHAHQLAFRHPHSHAMVRYEAMIPEDMAALLDWLRQHAPHEK